jgi:transcriptional regulator with XRE-family HTH domain
VASGSAKTLHHRETARFRRVASQLARSVRQRRAVRGWTLEAAAERFGIEPAHVRRIESANANPSLAVLTSVAAAFGVSVAELLTAKVTTKREAH